MNVTDLDLIAHVRWAQNPAMRGDWTAEADLQLAQSVIAGGLDRTAVSLMRPRAECRARWDLLFPTDMRTPRFQEVLLRALRASVEGEGEA